MAFYKKRIESRDTPEMVAWRIKNNAARKQAQAEREHAFPVITLDNFEAACAFQARRIEELMSK